LQYSLLPRFYLQELTADEQQYILTDATFHYLVNVLRLKDGDTLRVFAPSAGEWLASITEVRKREATISLNQCLRTDDYNNTNELILAVPPLKPARMAWLIEKATELGIMTIQPVLTQRSQPHQLHIDKWRRQAIEAAEQCERLSIPTILPAIRLEGLPVPKRSLWYGDESGHGTPLATMLQQPGAGPITLLVGPEGGFTPAELAYLSAHGNAIHLGPRVLRSETAALVMLISTFLAWGDTVVPLPLRT
jgi:16S rRNA (uracil1498-N3)-methyltransferase